MISEPVLCRSFIGRAQELAHVNARRRDAAAGHGGTVLIGGEAGVGKSRLLAEFRRGLPRRTIRVASGACRPFAQRALGPWLDVLATLDPAASASLAAHAFASKDDQMAALVETFERIAARATTIVMLEDLHWADPDIVQLLLVLTERAAGQRMLFIGTYRDDEVIAGHPSFPVLGRLLRDHATSLVRLRTFEDDEMAQLLRAALPPEPVMPADVLRDVRRRSDGNALFGEELLRHAVDRLRYGAEAGADPLPLSLDAIVRERLERCANEDRALLAHASLLGRSFDVELLVRIFGVPPEQCRSALERLTALQLVDPDTSGTSEYRFRHALTRDVVSAGIPPDDVPALHRHIAETIAGLGDDDAYAERLAHHYWMAGDRRRAAPFCVAAADAARALHAYEEAAAWYEKAADGYGGDVAAAAALVQAALMRVLCHDIDGAFARYERAGEDYERAGRFDDAIAARTMAAGPLNDSGRVDDAIAFLEETRRRLASRASAFVRSRLLVRIGFLYAFARRTELAWEAAQEIGPEVLASTSVLAAEAHLLHCALHAQRAEPGPWREHFERGLALFEELGVFPDNIRTALGNGGVQALCLGESELAREYQNRAYALARTLKSSFEHEALVLAELELRCGRLAAARELIDAHAEPVRFVARVQRAIVAVGIACLCGDDDLAGLVDDALLEEAIAGGHEAAAIKLLAAYGEAYETLGRAADADRLLRRASELISTVYDMTVPIATIVRLRPRSAATLRPLVAAAAERPSDRVNRALLAFVDTVIARDAEDSVTHERGRDAAARFAELDWRVLEAHALRAAGDDIAARQRFGAMGAHAEVRRLERRLFAVTNESAKGILTRRERELARLVAEGKTNRAAAQTLSISEKAIEKYLTSIYGKLGMSSRAQLAAYVATTLADQASAR